MGRRTEQKIPKLRRSRKKREGARRILGPDRNIHQYSVWAAANSEFGGARTGENSPAHPHRGYASEVTVNSIGAVRSGNDRGAFRPGSDRFRDLSQLRTTLGVLAGGVT